ncbi:PH domain-containing protein [Candidatus Woesearchaeota archaeon]|nr:PH domain-containing protein [Candidatus Woesearchaeota archaeon]
MEKLPFHLQERENIIQTIKPNKMFIFQNAITGAFFYFIIAFLIGLFTSRKNIFDSFNWFIVIDIIFFLILISLISSLIRYTKEKYWITNQRVIFRRGFFGYSVTSLPLERIVDVVISRSLFQQIFGTPSLHLDTFGSGSVGGGIGNYNAVSKGTIFAINNPEDLQRLILDLVKKQRKVEKLSM